MREATVSQIDVASEREQVRRLRRHFDRAARTAVEWTRRQLRPHNLRYLQELQGARDGRADAGPECASRGRSTSVRR
jgi:hypothetical protein